MKPGRELDMLVAEKKRPRWYKIAGHNKVTVDEEMIRHLYLEKKMTGREIAHELGVGVGTIYNRLRKLEIVRDLKTAAGVWYDRGNKPANYQGRYIEKRSGYIIACVPNDHKFASMGVRFASNRSLTIREHRLVMAEHLGRPLERWEVVHHKNHQKSDNRIENLELIQGQSKHQAETITHNEMLRLKSRVTMLESENIDLRQRLAALKAVGVEV